jgi:hypothetical protein
MRNINCGIRSRRHFAARKSWPLIGLAARRARTEIGVSAANKERFSRHTKSAPPSVQGEARSWFTLASLMPEPREQRNWSVIGPHLLNNIPYRPYQNYREFGRRGRDVSHTVLTLYLRSIAGIARRVALPEFAPSPNRAEPAEFQFVKFGSSTRSTTPATAPSRARCNHSQSSAFHSRPT